MAASTAVGASAFTSSFAGGKAGVGVNTFTSACAGGWCWHWCRASMVASTASQTHPGARQKGMHRGKENTRALSKPQAYGQDKMSLHATLLSGMCGPPAGARANPPRVVARQPAVWLGGGFPRPCRCEHCGCFSYGDPNGCPPLLPLKKLHLSLKLILSR